MAPNNLKHIIKQKLSQREIKPSEQAWDRLDAMLSVAENQPEKKRNWWVPILKIAAVFFIATAMVVLFLNQNETTIQNTPNNPAVVNTQKKTIENASKNSTNEKVINNEIKQLQNTKIEYSVPKREENTASWVQNTTPSKPSKSKVQQNTLQLIETNKIQPQLTKNEVVVAENTKNKSNPYINPDALLASAEGKKVENKVETKKSAVVVNSKELLSSVESELNTSFRDKVLNKVGKATDAFANRNYK